MTDGDALRGIAWDLIEEAGRWQIQRLPFILDQAGQRAGPNDIFASDGAAREFVEVMARAGNRECELALLKVYASEDEEEALPLALS